MALSEKRLAANRANAAKSTGPRTAIGKHNSSRNGTKHGLLSNAILVDGESRAHFVEILNTLENDYQPADHTERTLIQAMAVAEWRRLRLWTVETAGINQEQRLQSDSTRGESPAICTLLAIRACAADTGILNTLRRYEVQFDNQYNRALDRLLRVRSQKTPLPREPKDLDENKGDAQ